MPVRLVMLLLLSAAAWCAALVVLTAWRVIRPPRMSEGKALYLLKRLSPQDLGLAYRSMDFVVRDERGRPLKLAAWWIPAGAPSSNAVILLHGYGDAKIGSIAWAPTWHGLGWNVLAIDGRTHGESGGRFCSGGFHERDDLDQVIDQLRQQQPREAERLALFGISLGTGAATGAAARRRDIAAVVLDSPFADYRNAVRSHLARLNAPLATLHGLIVWLAGRWCGADWQHSRPADLLRQISCPVLILRGSEDDFVHPSDLAELDASLAARPEGTLSRTVIFNGAHHILGLTADPQHYGRVLATFLADANIAAVHPRSPANEIAITAASSEAGGTGGI
jgi:pimeloyl-ACP methyl ester carboxylesterase